MKNKIYILDEIYNKTIYSIQEDMYVSIIGGDKTGKTTVLNKIAEHCATNDIPCYNLSCINKVLTNNGESCGKDPLVLSTFYNPNKLNCNTKDNFLSIAIKIRSYLKSKDNGLLIIDDFENYGPTFLQNLLNIFMIPAKINILVAVNPLKYNFQTREELKNFSEVRIDKNCLNKAFEQNRNEIFKAFAIDEDIQTLIVNKSNNFDMLNFFIEHNKELHNETDYDFNEIFTKQLKAKSAGGIALLKTSATIGKTFEKRLLVEPLKISDADYDIKLLLQSGEIMKNMSRNGSYDFQFEQFFKYILDNVGIDDYKKCTSMLGSFLYNKAVRNERPISEEDYSLLTRSCIYMFESDRTDEACYLAFSLINYYYSKGKYDEVIALIDKAIEKATNMEIKLYLSNIAIRLLNTCAIYYKSSELISYARELHPNCKIAGINYLYINFLEAEKCYYFKEEIKANKILNSIIIDSKTLFAYPSIAYEVYSLKSSVSYNIYDKEDACNPLQYFSKAVTFGEKLRDDNYYKLLQKAVLFYIGESENLVNIACAHFNKTRNQIEEARSLNNLGVSRLEQKKYNDAATNFIAAQNIFSKFMSSLIAYPLNDLAAVKMLQNDYASAIPLLMEATKFSNKEEFTSITLFINLSACFYKLGDSVNSDLYYDKASTIISESLDGDSSFYELFLNTHNALRYQNSGKIEEANTFFKKFNTQHLFYKQLASLAMGETHYKTYFIPYLEDVLKNKVCPHYMVFE